MTISLKSAETGVLRCKHL